ncbi:MAG: hypothetical protein NT090_04635 [Acidobacteria bacterium]|nr:hypothetical protein [Acidobacteriota bacterium]
MTSNRSRFIPNAAAAGMGLRSSVAQRYRILCRVVGTVRLGHPASMAADTHDGGVRFQPRRFASVNGECYIRCPNNAIQWLKTGRDGIGRRSFRFGPRLGW